MKKSTEAEKLRRKFPQTFAGLRQAFLALDRNPRNQEVRQGMETIHRLLSELGDDFESPAKHFSEMYEVSIITNLLLMDRNGISDRAAIQGIKEAAKINMEEVAAALSLDDLPDSKQVFILDEVSKRCKKGLGISELVECFENAERIVDEHYRQRPLNQQYR